MIKLKDIRVVIMTLCIAVLMILTINTVVYGAETETNNTNVGLDSFDGMLSAVKELKDNKPQWFHRNINISEAQQKFQVVCVYDVCDECTVVYPVVFAVDGSKLDAKLTVKMKTDDSTGYSTIVNQNLTETFNVPNRWRKSTSGNLWGTYIPIYSNSHYSDKEKYRILSSMPLLKYDRSLGSADYGNTVQYAMDTYEKGWNNNPNYTANPQEDPSYFDETIAIKKEDIGYIKNPKFLPLGKTGSKSLPISIDKSSLLESGDDGCRIVWDNDVSTTGFDLSNAYVQVFVDVYANNVKLPPLGKKGNVGKGDFSLYETIKASDGHFDLLYDTIFDDSRLKSQWDIINKNPPVGQLNIDYRVDFKFRIIKYSGSEWTYGPMLFIDGSGTTRTVTDEDGNTTTLDENEKVNIDENGNETLIVSETTDLNWFLKQLNLLKDSLGQFPQLVSVVFGWLPSPVITLIGVGITIMIVVSLIRAVRG